MTEEAKAAAQAEAAAASAAKSLDPLDASPFSPPAFSLLKAQVAQHVTELVNESVKGFKRHLADTVSAAHVNRERVSRRINVGEGLPASSNRWGYPVGRGAVEYSGYDHCRAVHGWGHDSVCNARCGWSMQLGSTLVC